MWRVPCLLSRVFNRFHVTNSPASLCVTPAPHGEDECRNSTTLLPVGRAPFDNSHLFTSNSQSGYGEDDKRQDSSFRTYYRHFSRYTVLDAFSWGAAAVVFLQLARRIHIEDFHLKSGVRGNEHAWSFSLSRILASVMRHGTPALSQGILPCRDGAHDVGGTEQSSSSTDSSDSSPDCSSSDSDAQDGGGIWRDLSEQGECLHNESTHCFGGSKTPTKQELKTEGQDPKEILAEAVSRLQEANKSSVSIILNIMGLRHIRMKDYETAFSCFQMAADQGYNKAKYNVGVCYELGRGVTKDIERASAYYRCAAIGGHSLAQYQYAKYLLTQKDERSVEDTQNAIALLQQAAKSGLTEAQAYLGVFCMKEPYRDGSKAVRYLQLAADSGDTPSQYHLGLCYENGLGVRQNLQKALKLYQQAAASGHLKAQETLEAFYQKSLKGLANCDRLKVVSTPCLSTLERIALQLNTPGVCTSFDQPASSVHSSSLALPHSWSTGSICTHPVGHGLWSHTPESSNVKKDDYRAFLALPLSSEWTVGVG